MSMHYLTKVVAWIQINIQDVFGEESICLRASASDIGVKELSLGGV